MAKPNPLRFSTKYQDDETDLLYYGYRYYSTSTGRWLSRDAVDDPFWPNLYALGPNDPLLGFDTDGRSWTDPGGGRGPRPPTPPPMPPRPPPLHQGPTPVTENPQYGTLVLTDQLNVRVRYCCSNHKLVGLAVQLTGDTPALNLDNQLPPIPPNTYLVACCSEKLVQLGLTEKVTISDTDFPKSMVKVRVSYFVFDNTGQLVASDASAELIPQSLVDSILREKIKLQPSMIEGIRNAFSKLDSLCP